MVMVGDADPAMMEELIRARFGGWRARGRRRPSPITAASPRCRQPVAQPRLSGRADRRATLMLDPALQAVPHTMARERRFLEETLAAQIINRRLEAHARGESAFLDAAVGASRVASTSPTTPSCRSWRATATGGRR